MQSNAAICGTVNNMAEGKIEILTIKAEESDFLDDGINQFISEGWYPSGSPFVFDGMIHQQMIRKTEQPKKAE